jgi:hypothetical protein
LPGVEHGDLRRLGAASLAWNGQILPTYYDLTYRCEMEVVAFDSRRPHPRFQGMVEQLKKELMLAPVYCGSHVTDAMSIAALARAMQPNEVSAALPVHAA